MSVNTPIIDPTESPLTEYVWNQFGYQVQPIDVHNLIWNLVAARAFSQADIYGNSNGVISGLIVTAGSGMQFDISSGRGIAYSGKALVQLTTAGALGQPAAFNTGSQVANGTGMSSGQTRIDLLCLAWDQIENQTSGTAANQITDETQIVVIPGTPGTPGVAPSVPNTQYVKLANLTVHYGDTTAGQVTIDQTIRTSLPSLLGLQTDLAALAAVLLSPSSPQIGFIDISGSSVGNIKIGGYIDYPTLVTPSSPATGFYRTYYKADGNRYVFDPVYGEQLDIVVGVPYMWPNSSLPAGCVWLDGSLISTTTYARLYGVYGTKYGAGSGTFGVMDGRAGAFIGPDNYGQGAANRLSTNNVLGASGGASTHTNTLAEMYAHTHTQNSHLHSGVVTGLTESAVGFYASSSPNAYTATAFSVVAGVGGTNGNTNSTTATNNSAGSTSAYNIMNPYQVGGGWITRY